MFVGHERLSGRGRTDACVGSRGGGRLRPGGRAGRACSTPRWRPSRRSGRRRRGAGSGFYAASARRSPRRKSSSEDMTSRAGRAGAEQEAAAAAERPEQALQDQDEIAGIDVGQQRQQAVPELGDLPGERLRVGRLGGGGRGTDVDESSVRAGTGSVKGGAGRRYFRRRPGSVRRPACGFACPERRSSGPLGAPGPSDEAVASRVAPLGACAVALRRFPGATPGVRRATPRVRPGGSGCPEEHFACPGEHFACPEDYT
jgi:hypothetical protein